MRVRARQRRGFPQRRRGSRRRRRTARRALGECVKDGFGVHDGLRIIDPSLYILNLGSAPLGASCSEPGRSAAFVPDPGRPPDVVTLDPSVSTAISQGLAHYLIITCTHTPTAHPLATPPTTKSATRIHLGVIIAPSVCRDHRNTSAGPVALSVNIHRPRLASCTLLICTFTPRYTPHSPHTIPARYHERPICSSLCGEEVQMHPPIYLEH